MKSSKESMDRMLGDIAEQENRVRGVQQSIDESLGRMAEIDHELTTVREEMTANSNMVEGCRMKLGGRESSVAQLSDRVNKISVEARSMDSRIAMLSEMEKDYEGYSKAVKTVMREAGRGNLKGIHAPVANLIREGALSVDSVLRNQGVRHIPDAELAAVEAFPQEGGARVEAEHLCEVYCLCHIV